MKTLLFLIFFFSISHAYATTSVMGFPSGQPTYVCVPGDTNTKCGGLSSVYANSPLTGNGTSGSHLGIGTNFITRTLVFECANVSVGVCNNTILNTPITVPFGGTLKGIYLFTGDGTGTIAVVDIYRNASGSGNPWSSTNSIVGTGGQVFLLGSNYTYDTYFSGWTSTTINANDTIIPYISYASSPSPLLVVELVIQQTS